MFFAKILTNSQHLITVCFSAFARGPMIEMGCWRVEEKANKTFKVPLNTNVPAVPL